MKRKTLIERARTAAMMPIARILYAVGDDGPTIYGRGWLAGYRAAKRDKRRVK